MNNLCQSRYLSIHPLHQLHLDPKQIPFFKIKNQEALPDLVSKCIKKIQEMAEIVKNNNNLNEYFIEAGTNSTQIWNILLQLKQDLQIIQKKFKTSNTNLIIINDVLNYINQILTENNLYQMQSIQKAIWILEFQSKVICSMQFILNSLYLPYDITTMEKNYFQKVWNRIKIQKFQNDTITQEGLNTIKVTLTNLVATLLDEQKQNSSIAKSITFGLSFSYYSVFDNKSKLRSMKFYRKPTVHQVTNLINFTGSGMIKNIAKMSLSNIVTNKKIYIPINYQSKEPKDIFVNDGQSLQLRIIYNKQIYSKQKKKQTFKICVPNIVQHYQDIDTIIFFIHGGGFLAGSSGNCQFFTRQWAIGLKIPIISVDYRKSPKHKFPTASFDCLNAYKFLLNKIHKYLNIRPKKIILAGESAGGNLVFSLCGLILKQKLLIPHGIYTAYPPCNLSKTFTPSKLYTFTEPFLSPALILLLLNQYLQDQSKAKNPIASPLLYTQQFIGGVKGDKRFPLKWPKTIIHVGAKDPLYDDSLLMMERMVSSNVDCQCYVYENLQHGFLSLGNLFKNCLKTIQHAQNHLEKLLK